MILTAPQTLKIITSRLPHTLAEHASRGQWTPYRYLQMIGNLIAQKVRSGGGRLIVNMPPRTGKSELLARWVPAWFLENWPERKVINGAHGTELARSHGRAVRNMFADNEYFTTQLREDSHAANRWNTNQGGGMVCAGVGTGLLGFGGHLLLLDDPYPGWAEAQSAVYRSRVLEWFNNTFLSRAEPGATIVLLQQRMHIDDLTGVLMKEQPDEWEQVSLAAIAEENDPLGRLPGEAICPERYSIDDLLQMRRRQIGGDAGWNAMYQQRPQRMGSGVAYRRFTDAHIEIGTAFNPRLPLQIGIDFNISPGMYAECGQYDPHTDQFTVVEEVHAPSMDLIDCLNVLTEVVKRHPWPEVQIFGDPTGGTQRSTQSSYVHNDLIRDHLRRIGIANPVFKFAKAAPPVVERVSTVNDALADLGGVHHVRIHPRCTRLIRDFTELKLDENGQPDKTNKQLTHSSDAFGYRVHFQRPIGGPIIQKTGAFVFG